SLNPVAMPRLRQPTNRIEDAILEWCPGTESNRHAPFGARDFKSRASASFATRAGFVSYWMYSSLSVASSLSHFSFGGSVAVVVAVNLARASSTALDAFAKSIVSTMLYLSKTL